MIRRFVDSDINIICKILRKCTFSIIFTTVTVWCWGNRLAQNLTHEFHVELRKLQRLLFKSFFFLDIWFVTFFNETNVDFFLAGGGGRHWLCYPPWDEYIALPSRQAIFRPSVANIINVALNPSQYLYKNNPFLRFNFLLNFF